MTLSSIEYIVRWEKMDNESISIMVVEDNTADVLLIQEMLKEINNTYFKIVTTDRLNKALNQISKDDFDAILLDLGLVDSQGIETFRMVKQQSPELPVIILSGRDDEDFATEAVKEGAQDYLVKGQVDGRLMARSIRYAIERKHAEEKLKKALKEKELLIKEIHHRVKNNLMMISGLLNLQSQYIHDQDDLQLFRESQFRANSMALIHERLYKSEDLKSIDFDIYIRKLVVDLFRTYVVNSDLLKLNIDVDDIMLDIDSAIPLGLIVNELLSNSLKHAFPDGREGEIHISFHFKDNRFFLVISDNGIGFPEDLDYRNTSTLGLRIVNLLTDQIGGEIELNRDGGTEFRISFQEEKYD